MGMNLSDGGHLTHGLKVNFSGRGYSFHHYGLREDTGRIDYDQVREVARTVRPKMIVAGASAYPREIDFPAFRAIADEVGAVLMVDMAHIAGLVAAGVHPSPFGHAQWITTTTHKTLAGPRGGTVFCGAADAARLDKAVFPGLQGGPLQHVIAGKAVCFYLAGTEEFRERQRRTVANARAMSEELRAGGLDLVSGGTDNHLILIDLTSKDVPGKIAAKALDRARLTLNYNTVPFDPRKPFDPSGIRLGTPSVTTRGMSEADMARIAEWMDRVIAAPEDTALGERTAAEVAEFCRAYPAPGIVVGD